MSLSTTIFTMAKVVKIFKTIRNNWKKSLFGTIALSYGVSYSKDTYDTEQLMRDYCENAALYGDQLLKTSVKPRHVTVILNPTANKRKAKKNFEKYCEPILHLAGIAVTIIQTESEGQARNLVAELPTHTDAIIVAGGDGTLSDVVTGLMRKYQENLNLVKNCPIGILPLGKSNTICNSLFNGYTDLPEIRGMAEASMAIVMGNSKLLDVIKVEPMEPDPDSHVKPVYGVAELEWGAWRDAHARINKYWYWGSLKKYVSYIFSGYKSDVCWNCNAVLKYTDPCTGCSRCYQKSSYKIDDKNNRRWWHVFVPRQKIFTPQEKDYSGVVNEHCGEVHEIELATTKLHVMTTNTLHPQSLEKPLLKINLGPTNVDYSSYVAEGWRRENGREELVDKEITAKEIQLHVKSDCMDKNQYFSIDNEEFELMSVKMKLLSNSIKVFCRNEINASN